LQLNGDRSDAILAPPTLKGLRAITAFSLRKFARFGNFLFSISDKGFLKNLGME